LKRQLLLPVSTISQWWVRRSSSAVGIFASPKAVGHSTKARLVVTVWNQLFPDEQLAPEELFHAYFDLVFGQGDNESGS